MKYYYAPITLGLVVIIMTTTTTTTAANAEVDEDWKYESDDEQRQIHELNEETLKDDYYVAKFEDDSVELYDIQDNGDTLVKIEGFDDWESTVRNAPDSIKNYEDNVKDSNDKDDDESSSSSGSSGSSSGSNSGSNDNNDDFQPTSFEENLTTNEPEVINNDDASSVIPQPQPQLPAVATTQGSAAAAAVVSGAFPGLVLPPPAEQPTEQPQQEQKGEEVGEVDDPGNPSEGSEGGSNEGGDGN